MRFGITFLLMTYIFASCTIYEADLRSPANIFYHDDRETLFRKDFPQWGSLHDKPVREKPWGTAFVIDHCYIGSAYHVVAPTTIELKGNEVVFFDSPLRETPIKATPVKRGKAWSASQRELNAQDWVILKLEECFSVNEVEPLKLVSLKREQLIDHPLMLAGFPQDRHPKNITVDFECLAGPEVLSKDNGIGHDCGTKPGNSGSPLISRMPGRDGEVVAVVVASRGHFQEIIDGYSEWIANKAAPIGPMAKALEELKKPLP